MNFLRNIFTKRKAGPKETKRSNRSMGKKSKESLKLFGSHAAPTGWGYLSGGMFNLEFPLRNLQAYFES